MLGEADEPVGIPGHDIGDLAVGLLIGWIRDRENHRPVDAGLLGAAKRDQRVGIAGPRRRHRLSLARVAVAVNDEVLGILGWTCPAANGSASGKAPPMIIPQRSKSRRRMMNALEDSDPADRTKRLPTPYQLTQGTSIPPSPFASAGCPIRMILAGHLRLTWHLLWPRSHSG